LQFGDREFRNDRYGLHVTSTALIGGIGACGGS
jgi:hypothetical protein